jgi:TonB family protein
VRGVVVVRLAVDASGKPGEVVLLHSLGPAFDAAARASLAECVFTPASVDGVPAPAQLEMTIEFVPPVEPWTLRGVVVGELGEALDGARVSFGEQSVAADPQGRFSLVFESLVPGDQWVTVEHEGYALKGFPEVYQPGRTTQVRYALVKQRGFETRVTGSRLLPAVPDADRTPQVSRFVVTRADIDRTPGAMEDIARVVQQIPGVAADPDLLANFFVRGGGPEETVFYIDGIPLSNPYHLGGFASIFNPMMIESAEFYGGGAPARYEPALSGVLEVKYATGEAKRLKVQADVSMQTAKVRADIPLGLDGLSAVVSFRRSYFEIYFAALKALGVVGTNVVAPDITEGLARVAYRRGAHLTTLTFLHASDGFNFVVKPGEEVLVNFAGGLRLSNTAQIAALRHSIDLKGDSNLSMTAAYTRDQNAVSVESERRFSNDALRHEVLARADVVLAHSEQNRSGLGVQYAWRRLSLTGEVSDTRDVAPWAREPIVDSERPYLPVAPSLSRHLLSLYAEHTLRPAKFISFEAGVRGQFDASNGQMSGSARLATALVLPTLTVLKLSGGFVLQPSLLPLALDPTYGNPGLGPERSIQLIGALEQPLPFEALLRFEGWGKWLSNLVVNPDTRAALEERLARGERSFASLGTGAAWGGDLLLVGRLSTIAYSLGAGLVFSERSNPLASGRQQYPVQWEQRFTSNVGISWSPNSKWIFTTRANLRTGRPYTPVIGFTADALNQRWLPEFGGTSSERYPLSFELSLRGEYRFALGPISSAVYVEVLNLTNTQNVFTYMYGAGDFAAGVEPARTSFNHLPIRPFLGLRGEW